jgi:hypothetical protein
MLFKLAFRIFLLGLLVYIVSQAPGLIEFFVTLFQAIGVYVIALIKTQPLVFAIGFVLMYGLSKQRA